MTRWTGFPPFVSVVPSDTLGPQVLYWRLRGPWCTHPFHRSALRSRPTPFEELAFIFRFLLSSFPFYFWPPPSLGWARTMAFLRPRLCARFSLLFLSFLSVGWRRTACTVGGSEWTLVLYFPLPFFSEPFLATVVIPPQPELWSHATPRFSFPHFPFALFFS